MQNLFALIFGIAQDYQGSCNLRFDDTKPRKRRHRLRSLHSGRRFIGWVFEWQGDTRYSSNYFDQLHGYAVELIEKGLAYVDFSSQEAMREMRGTLTATWY